MKIEFTKSEFIAFINKERIMNRGRWICGRAVVAGQLVRYKSFDCYLQRLEVDGIDCAPCMGLNVTGWKAAINEAI